MTGSTVCRFWIGVVLFLLAAASRGQFMPEVPAPAKTSGPPAEAAGTNGAVAALGPAGAAEGAIERMVMKVAPEMTHPWIDQVWDRFLAPSSRYRPLILTVVTLLLLLQLKRILTRAIKGYVEENAFDRRNVTGFMKVWNWIWKFVIAVLVLIALSGSLRLLGLTAGFLGMMLGWSLQQPVTGIAAWLMIILKKPFQLGDRVIIAGITGDVTGITLTHVVLNQVGGSVGGEERSGRGILIPNAILFQNTIINYTLDQKYMLDEVPVRLTFTSDWDLAKEIMIRSAAEVTREIIAETKEQPFIRAEFLDWGILVRLRYQTIPVRRQEISTYIIEHLLKEFRKAYPRVRIAIPATRVRYRADAIEETPGAPLSEAEGMPLNP